MSSSPSNPIGDVGDTIPDLIRCVKHSVEHLKDKVGTKEPFTSSETDQLGKAARLVVQLSQAAGALADRTKKASSKLTTEDLLREVGKSPEIRRTMLAVLSEHLTHEDLQSEECRILWNKVRLLANNGR